MHLTRNVSMFCGRLMDVPTVNHMYCCHVSLFISSTYTTYISPVLNKNVLLNDTLNTFHLLLYGKGPLKIGRDETCCRHMAYTFPINSKGSFICTTHTQDSTYHGLCYTSRGALAGTRNSSLGPPHEGSIRRPIAP